MFQRYETNEAGLAVPVCDGNALRVDVKSKYHEDSEVAGNDHNVEDRDMYPTFGDLQKLDDNSGTNRHNRYDVNYGMTQDQARDTEAAIHMEKTSSLKVRRLMPPTNIKPSARFFVYTVRAHMSAADIIGPGQTVPTDAIAATQTSVKILKLAKGVNLPREFVMGTDLVQANIISLTRQVSELENLIGYHSCTLPDVDGLIDDAGNTTAGTATWDNAPGTSFALTDVQRLLSLMAADGFEGPYWAMFEPVNKYEGEKQLNAAGDGGLLLAKPGLLVDYWSDISITTGTAIVVQVDRTIATMAVAEDITIIIDNPNNSNQTQLITCHERVAPAIMQPNGVGSLTGI